MKYVGITLIAVVLLLLQNALCKKHSGQQMTGVLFLKSGIRRKPRR